MLLAAVREFGGCISLKTLLGCVGGGILLLLLVPGRGREEDGYMNCVVMGARGQLLIGGGSGRVGRGGVQGKPYISLGVLHYAPVVFGGREGEQAQSIGDQISAKAVEAR